MPEALFFTPDSGLIANSPLFHGSDDGAHRFTQLTQGIFHPWRDLRIDCAGDDSIIFHRTQAVGQYLLADALQRSFQFVETSRPLQKISQNQQFPFTAYQLYSGGDGHSGSSAFVSIMGPPVHYNFMLYSTIIYCSRKCNQYGSL